MNFIPNRDLIARALEEDAVGQDVSVEILGDSAGAPATGVLVAQGDFVLAGQTVAECVFNMVDADLVFDSRAEDGELIESGRSFGTVKGRLGSILSAERTALNFLQHLSGIATATHAAVKEIEGTGASIADTRKTIPGLRQLAKYAVRVGGGVNNRESLADTVFLKDNHWVAIKRSELDLRDVVALVPEGKGLVVEVDTHEEFQQALDAGCQHILADNQTPATIARWVVEAGEDVAIEASGGITLANVKDYAEAGARFISMGALTHSVIAAPIGLEIGA